MTTNNTNKIIHGDCLEVMKKLPENSIDAIVSDPPYGLEFMGKEWDKLNLNVPFKESEKGGMGGYKHHIRYGDDGNEMQSWHYNWAIEALRVAKPGSHMLAFGGTRTHHRLMCAIEDAGWEIRDTLGWLYGSGFPKSHNISKAIDKSRGGIVFNDVRNYLKYTIKQSGITQKKIKKYLKYPEDSGVIGHWIGDSQPSLPRWNDWQKMKDILPLDNRFDDFLQTMDREIIGRGESGIGKAFGDGQWISGKDEFNITSSSSPEAIQWDGWGSALKPAWEPIILARKPLNCTIAENVLKWGTGGINIDGCRVEFENGENGKDMGRDPFNIISNQSGLKITPTLTTGNNLGRFPANLILDGSDEVVSLFPNAKGGNYPKERGKSLIGFASGKFDGDLPAHSMNDNGSAARFFYCAKASSAERNKGLDDLPVKEVDTRTDTGKGSFVEKGMAAQRNIHPTVKPVKLMRYLCKLITPPGGVILDPFAGSGTTGMAAIEEGFNYILIDNNEEYCQIAAKRVAATS